MQPFFVSSRAFLWPLFLLGFSFMSRGFAKKVFDGWRQISEP